MTYNDLYKEIIALGFESEIDSEERVISSVNRALGTIFAQRPAYSTVTIYQRKLNPVLKIDLIEHRTGEIDTVNYDARCFSFVSFGAGSCKITEGESERVFSFSGENKLQRGFLHGEGKMEFYGDFSFSVKSLVFFDELFGASESDIPFYTEILEYDISDYCEDFISFAQVPFDQYGKAIAGATICGRKIRIPNSYNGIINVTYKKGAKRVRGVADEEIMTPDGCQHLVALLAASYIWLDDDSEKAEYYMSLYRDGMSALKYYNRAEIGADYHSTNGWA